MAKREMKIGDKVLCVGSYPGKNSTPSDVVEGGVRAGQEYVIDGFCCCPHCGHKCITLQGYAATVNIWCGDCTGRVHSVREFYSQTRFVLPDLESLHQHRTEVSAKELLTIKEIQHQ